MIAFPLSKLKDLPISIIDGDRSAKYPKREEFLDLGVPFLSSTNILPSGRFDFQNMNYISEQKFASIKKGRVQGLDVVMTTRGSSVGKVACIPSNFRGLINAQMLILRADNHQFSSKYLFYWLLGSDGQKILKNFSSGSAQPQIPIRDLQEIELPVPSFDIQCRIATILSAYDDLIENNTRRIAVLEEMARRIYEEWFVHFRYPGHEQAQKVETELGLVPEGWEPKTLGDVAFETRDSVHPDSLDAETPYVGLEHIPRRSLALGEWGRAGDVQSTKLRFKKGDILFGKIRPYFHKVSVAPVAGVASSDAIVIRAKEDTLFALVLSVVSSDAFVAQATQSSNGTKMPRANWAALLEYPVPLPPADLLATFDAFVLPALAQIQTLTMKNRNLRQTRDLLLPRLISGELDVSKLAMPEIV